MFKCKGCGGGLRKKVVGDDESETREQRCDKCGGGFRWTIWRKEGRLIKKLYEVLNESI